MHWGKGGSSHAFSTDLKYMMNGEDISVWAYGHTHWYHDMVFNGTRVVSNPHGYPKISEDLMNYDHKNDETKCYSSSFCVEI